MAEGLLRKIASPLVLAASLTFITATTEIKAQSPSLTTTQKERMINDIYLGESVQSFVRLGIINARNTRDIQLLINLHNNLGHLIRHNERALILDAIKPRDVNIYLNYERNRVDPNYIPQTFVCNYYRDFDNNKRSSLDEFVGLNKKSFNSNESFLFGMYLPITRIKGKSYSMKTFNPKGELIYEYKGKFVREPEVSSKEFDMQKLVNAHGEGTYAIAFYIENKHWNTIQFDLVDSNRMNNENKNSKLIEGIILDPEEGKYEIVPDFKIR